MKNTVDAVKVLLERQYTDCCIFFLCRGKVDAANPLYKVFKSKDIAVSYDKITENEKTDVLLKIAKEKNIDISASVINFLIRYTNADLLSLVNELDKLNSYKRSKIQIKDIEEICHASTDYNMFLI